MDNKIVQIMCLTLILLFGSKAYSQKGVRTGSTGTVTTQTLTPAPSLTLGNESVNVGGTTVTCGSEDDPSYVNGYQVNCKNGVVSGVVDENSKSRTNAPSTMNGGVPADCSAAATHAKEVCTTGQAIAPVAANASKSLSGLSSAQASGDALSACSDMGTAAEMQSGINAAFAGTCDMAINECANKCDTNGAALTDGVKATNALASTCLSYKTAVYLSGAQATLALTSLTQIAACKQAAAATQCLQANAVNNSACPTQYCTLPAHTTDPVCQALANATSCANPANASMAICQSASSGSLTAGTLPTSGINSALAAQELPTVPTSAPFTGTPAGAVAPNAGGNSGGYASGLGNGGSALGQKAAAAADAKNPEVFLGSGNGSTAGMDQLGSHDYDPSVLARANGDASMAGFNINKYLPKKAGLRGPASIDPNFLLKNGITSANGLSNWEKITKKLREKQPELRK